MRSTQSACSRRIKSWSAAIIRGAPIITACASVAVLTATCLGPARKLVCLRNNKRKGLLNGGLFQVAERGRASPIIKLTLRPEETATARAFKVSVRPECFVGGIEELAWDMRKRYDEFDFGYVLTVHKAQGSQWDDVVLFDESAAFAESRRRWLYTGITRAAKRLTVVM